MDAKPHALYRFFDAHGDLLYVGITLNPAQRWRAHMGDKPWWTEVANITLEEHSDRDSVLAAERAAIKSERPRFNVVHQPKSGQPADVPQVAEREPVQNTMLKDGEVVAVALEGWKCPVGMVKNPDRQGATLSLYHWVTGTFGYGDLYIPYSRIICLRKARTYSHEEKLREGYSPSYTVFDMDPLGAFQSEWNSPPSALSPAEVQQIKRALADPRHSGPVLPPDDPQPMPPF